MITPASIQYISQVLADPNTLTESDKESIDMLIDAYPYLLPVRFLDAALEHKKQPYSASMLTTMELYQGNYLQFSRFLYESLGADAEYILSQPSPSVVEEHAEEKKDLQPESIEAEILPTQSAQADQTVEIGKWEVVPAEKVLESAPAEAIKPAVAEIPEMTVDLPPFIETGTIDDFSIPHVNFDEDASLVATDETLILPMYTEDYFYHQGIEVSNAIPNELQKPDDEAVDPEKSLMVMMSFSEWLAHYKRKDERQLADNVDRKALKAMRQKEKLAAAMEEENEEIPEDVFEMAVNSIAKEENLISESLAEVHSKQGKYDIAINMYRKLSLGNPHKSAYFAKKIEDLIKLKKQ